MSGICFAFVTQNATVLRVELSHVTLALDSVAVDKESLDRAVSAVK